MKVIVITGANRGVGLGIAQVFHEISYKVIGLNRTFCEEEWMEEIYCDVSDPTSIQHAIKQVDDLYKQIDIVVCNAGVRHFSPIHLITQDEWEESLKVNLSAPLFMIKYTFDLLSKNNGMMFFIGSHAGEYPFENGVAYSSTKAGLHAMVEVAIQDLRYHNIRTCCLSLGAISNIALPDDEWKLTPTDIGELIVSLSNLHPRVLPAYVEMRPAKPKPSPVIGLERLQYI
ncbi:oxidoreductase [Caldalkalibacillus thermarum]|uniref:SDR family NAD(P)-dependent oxidoreductase n=1 Tax=Caldalkalibacillus thermarum TaxID=296745 RepID=UPI001664FD3A|nr:SDR family NAD(P)-dependent oxidoreductase [Caldalkalibacillus thermarum]GGK34810.1 oxidoreductase [Caldalkalibacillus thermarum]